MDVRFCERRDHSREAPDARAKDLDQKRARSHERAWPRVFFLDRRLTWMSDSHNSKKSLKLIIRSWAYGVPVLACYNLVMTVGFTTQLFSRRYN